MKSFEQFLKECRFITKDHVLKNGIMTCPHCNEEIHEKGIGMNDAGETIHKKCGSHIELPESSPETKVWLSQFSESTKPVKFQAGDFVDIKNNRGGNRNHWKIKEINGDTAVLFYPTAPETTEFPVSDLVRHYPLAKQKDMDAYADYPDWKGIIVYMSPDKYLSFALPLKYPDKRSLEKLRDRMRKNQPIDPPVLEIRNWEVVTHDGRHRATIAKELGIKSIPVLIVPLDLGRVPTWTDEERKKVEGLNFTAEK